MIQRDRAFASLFAAHVQKKPTTCWPGQLFHKLKGLGRSAASDASSACAVCAEDKRPRQARWVSGSWLVLRTVFEVAEPYGASSWSKVEDLQQKMQTLTSVATKFATFTCVVL
jgi:hypothetical protein